MRATKASASAGVAFAGAAAFAVESCWAWPLLQPPSPASAAVTASASSARCCFTGLTSCMPAPLRRGGGGRLGEARGAVQAPRVLLRREALVGEFHLGDGPVFGHGVADLRRVADGDEHGGIARREGAARRRHVRGR